MPDSSEEINRLRSKIQELESTQQSKYTTEINASKKTIAQYEEHFKVMQSDLQQASVTIQTLKSQLDTATRQQTDSV